MQTGEENWGECAEQPAQQQKKLCITGYDARDEVRAKEKKKGLFHCFPFVLRFKPNYGPCPEEQPAQQQKKKSCITGYDQRGGEREKEKEMFRCFIGV